MHPQRLGNVDLRDPDLLGGVSLLLLLGAWLVPVLSDLLLRRNRVPGIRCHHSALVFVRSALLFSPEPDLTCY